MTVARHAGRVPCGRPESSRACLVFLDARDISPQWQVTDPERASEGVDSTEGRPLYLQRYAEVLAT